MIYINSWADPENISKLYLKKSHEEITRKDIINFHCLNNKKYNYFFQMDNTLDNKYWPLMQGIKQSKKSASTLAKYLNKEFKPIHIGFLESAIKNIICSINLLNDLKILCKSTIRLLVQTIYIFGIQSKEEGGGVSFLDLPGIIWLHPVKNWDIYTYGESLLHETVHQLINIYDATLGLIQDSGFDESIKVPSAIRDIYSSHEDSYRPFWGTYHAAIVTHYLIIYFKKTGNLSKVDLFHHSLTVSLPFLLARKDLMTSHGYDLLKQIHITYT